MVRPVGSGAIKAPSYSRQGGVALAIVVWFIAGMSLLVAGIVAQAKVDTRMAQIHVARAKAEAAGDGAIQLMMVDLMTAKVDGEDSGQMPAGRYRLGDIEAMVSLVPVAGLIDLNRAPVELLSALFQQAGGLGMEEAQQVAENVVESRTAAVASTDSDSGGQFTAIEDLLRVPGTSRTLLDAVRDFIVVGEAGQGSMNWSLAPEALLDVLAVANPAQADAVRARRGSPADSYPRPPGRTGPSPGQAATAQTEYRADATVRYGDKIWLRRRWISIESSTSTSLPWHVVHTEPARVLMQDSYLPGMSVDA